jgi:hypothetical protein
MVAFSIRFGFGAGTPPITSIIAGGVSVFFVRRAHRGPMPQL